MGAGYQASQPEVVEQEWSRACNNQVYAKHPESYFLTATWQHAADPRPSETYVFGGLIFVGVTFKIHATRRPNAGTCCLVMVQVMAKYLWSNMTPWFRNDVDFVTHAKEAVEGSPFFGLHVRRGDKLIREAEAVPVEVRSARVRHVK